MSYSAYILKSQKSGSLSLYIGFTKDLPNRIEEHNQGRNISTQNKGPWKLIYSENYSNLLLAKNREKFFKTGRGRAVIKNIVGA